MGDVTYRVVTELSLKGDFGSKAGQGAKEADKLSQNLAGAKAHLGGLASNMGDFAGKVTGAFTGAVEQVGSLALGFAKLGIGGGLAAATYGVAVLNRGLEDTRISIAAVLNANGATSGMGQALGQSAALMSQMRKDAADLPGEFKDLKDIFTLGLNPAMKAGLDPQKFSGMAAKAMAAAAATEMNMPQASREFAQLLQGRAGTHNVFGTQLGIGKELNQQSAGDRVKTIETALNKFAPAIEIFKTSFSAISSTLIDNAKMILGTATLPLFNRVKATMSEANEWFEKHGTSAREMADSFGVHLAHAWEKGVAIVKDWYPAIRDFVMDAKMRIESIWDRIGPGIEKAAGALKDALSNGTALDKIESILKLYGVAKVGGMGVGLAKPLIGAAGNLGGAVGFMGGGAAAAGPAGAAASVGMMFDLALAAGVAAGQLSALTDVNSKYHAKAVATQTKLDNELAKLSGTVSVSLIPALEWWGVNTVKVGTEFITVFNDLLGPMDLVRQAFNHISIAGFKAGDALMSLRPKEMAERLRFKAPDDPNKAPLPFDAQTKRGAIEIMASGAKEMMKDTLMQKPKTGAGGGGGGTSIQKVEIVVNSNQDPSRIARRVKDVLAEIGRNPTSSRYVNNYTSGNR